MNKFLNTANLSHYKVTSLTETRLDAIVEDSGQQLKK